MPKRWHSSLKAISCCRARVTNSRRSCMVSCGFQGMVGSRHRDAQKCQPCPRGSVSYVPGLYTAAKKVTAAPGRGSANKPKRKRDPATSEPEPTQSKRYSKPLAETHDFIH